MSADNNEISAAFEILVEEIIQPLHQWSPKQTQDMLI